MTDTATPINTINTSEIEFEILQLRKKIAKNDLQTTAIKYLSTDLTNILDLGEAINAVNKYLWELLDYSVALYLVYNYGESRFESRGYLKEQVDTGLLINIKTQINEYLKINSEKTIIGAFSALSTMQPLLFGIPLKEQNNVANINSYFITPLTVGSKIVGVLYIGSVKNVAYTNEDKDIVQMLINLASVSFARIQTSIQSLNSRTESLVQSLSEGVVMFDLNGKTTLANPAAEKFTGLPKEGYDLQELSKLFTDVDLTTMTNNAITKGEIVHIQKAVLKPFYYEIFIVPVKDLKENIVGGAIIFHDITHVVEVDKMKTEFVSLASHQLRTPLGTVKWYAEMLLNGDVGEISSNALDFIKTISQSNQRMIDLVNALLNISRLEMGTFMVNPVKLNLVEMCKNEITELDLKAKKGEVAIIQKYENESIEVPVDKDLMQMIFHNLLTNSIKYTPKGGNVNVEIKNFQNNVLIIIADTGYGIPIAQQSQIFSKLFRADNVKTLETEGTGLGLYIVKSILEQTGGSISFVSEENKGTTFTLTLPVTGMLEKKGTKKLETKREGGDING